MKTQLYYYSVEGFFMTKWKILFAPYLTEKDANAKADALRGDNPACKYRVVMRYF